MHTGLALSAPVNKQGSSYSRLFRRIRQQPHTSDKCCPVPYSPDGGRLAAELAPRTVHYIHAILERAMKASC